jgi:hypothetical protein
MDRIHVISRETIPSLHQVSENGTLHDLGELKDFRWNDELKEFLPPESEFSASWVRLGPGEVLQPHVHPIQSMMVFYAGSGQMLGDLTAPIAEDTVVVVPAGCRHGFVGGPDGLCGLSIQFGQGLYTQPEAPRVAFVGDGPSLDSLLAYNRKRLAEFAEKPIFELLSDGTLDDPHKRKVYLDTLQIWVDGNQSLLFSRQSSTVDPVYAAMFLKHFQEEVGHEVLHRERADGSLSGSSRDVVMEAITNWFTYQMFVLDDCEKTAIIHLVIENASSAYHQKARPALAKYTSEHYFDVHVHADSEHAAMGEALLGQETAETYQRLQRMIGEAWDMLGAMTDRLVQVTRAA